ncbi:MAG TPA: L,D-transpeptidase family protein [Sphingomicrobium sp.]|jgi:murein L,D-transpeptidase YcbB/YkuD
MLRWSLVVAAALSASAHAQDVAPLAVPAQPAARIVATPPDSNVARFYAARPATLIWLRDATSRAAASRLAEILKRAPADGVADGPMLAASVEAALASGTPLDDQQISRAWVRYVQALKAPVEGFGFGDPALQLKAPDATPILLEALSAPSLAAHIDAVANVNPIYSALRAAAIEQGQQDDPRVRATLDRLRLVPGKGRAILVDVANAEMMMLQDGQVVDSMKVIVGKQSAQTPLLAGTIHYVTLNPYWHIPQDVTKRVVAPLVLKRGVSYLKAARYDTVAAFGGDKAVPVDPESIDWKAVAAGDIEAHVRQRAGGNNMMGKMKFGFVNDQGIFLHDTPHKNLFAKAKRTLSLGCVRLEHPERLATWLLGRDPVPSGDGPEENVLIAKGVPIYISYLTARPDGNRVAFATDIYKLDTTEPLASGTSSAKR